MVQKRRLDEDPYCLARSEMADGGKDLLSVTALACKVVTMEVILGAEAQERLLMAPQRTEEENQRHIQDDPKAC